MQTDLTLAFVFVPAGAAPPPGWRPVEVVVVPAQHHPPEKPRPVPLRDRSGMRADDHKA